MRDFAYSWITEQPTFVPGLLCSETLITLKPCFSPYFSVSCCMRIRPISVTWLGIWRTRRIDAHPGQVALVCHRNVLSCGYCLTLGTVGLRRCESLLDAFCTQVMQYSTSEYTSLKQNTRQIERFRYLECFWFSFCQGYIVNKTRHYSAEGTPLHMFHRHYGTGDWVLHIVDNLSFYVSFFVHNSWIWAQFDDLAADLGLRYRVHRALSNTEKMLFGVCFAFPMCKVLHDFD